MSGVVCPRRYCGERMEFGTDGQGRVVATCAACERNRRGLCRECPRPRADSHAMRCPPCSAARKLALGRDRDRERYPHRRRAVLRHHKQRGKIPAIREHRIRYMAAYRQANPRDANDRAYQRAYMAARRADPAFRSRQNARKRELRLLAKERAA